MKRALVVLALAAFVTATAAAQWLGMPSWNSPKGGGVVEARDLRRPRHVVRRVAGVAPDRWQPAPGGRELAARWIVQQQAHVRHADDARGDHRAGRRGSQHAAPRSPDPARAVLLAGCALP